MATGRPYEFDLRLNRYRDKRSGRLVSDSAVRRAIDTALRNDRVRAKSLAESLRAGRISRDRWALEMKSLVREVHLYSAAAAKGGWAEMDNQAWGQVGAAVREQNAFLEQFVGQVNTTLPLDGRFTVRAMSYVEAGRSTFHRVEKVTKKDAGKTEVRNILVDRTHACSECPELTERGWVPIDQMPPPGERQCLFNCRCRLEFRVGEDVLVTPIEEIPETEVVPDFSPTEASDPRSWATAQLAQNADSFVELQDTVRSQLGLPADSREDPLLLGLLEDRGFTGLPTVVSREELDRLVVEGKYLEAHRGMTKIGDTPATVFTEQWRTGRYYAGLGGYGNGTYVSVPVQGGKTPIYGVLDAQVGGKALQTAKTYGSSGTDKGAAVRMAFRPTARVTTHSALLKEQDAFLERLRKIHQEQQDKLMFAGPEMDRLFARQRAELAFFEDTGRYGVAAGYDGYSADAIDDAGYFVVLNRRAVVVQREDLIL